MLAVLRLPGVRSLFAFSCIGRLPMGALGLLMILVTHDRTDSFASGGLVAASYTIALGFSNPALARWVDRAGQTVVLRSGAVDWDLGYTRSVQRPDGQIVTVYYYNDATAVERYIAATIWAP